MQCQLCKKAPATVHLTWIVEGEIEKKRELCELCAKAEGVWPVTGTAGEREREHDG